MQTINSTTPARAALRPTEAIGDKQAIYIALFVPIMLWLDAETDIVGQMLIGLASWASLLWLMRGFQLTTRWLLWACLLYATAGELFLSLAWGLYEYRLGNVPLFVPPGHVMLFLLGQYLSLRAPGALPWLVAGSFTLIVGWSSISGVDQLSALLLLFFLASLFTRADRRLLGSMFLIALSLELTGTALGNWYWAKEVPLWGLGTTNPPIASGSFYCLLDVLVLVTLAPFLKGSQRETGTSENEASYNRAPSSSSRPASRPVEQTP